MFWAKPSSQDKDVELDSIFCGKTMQGVKDRFGGFPVPRIAKTCVLDFGLESGEQT